MNSLAYPCLHFLPFFDTMLKGNVWFIILCQDTSILVTLSTVGPQSALLIVRDVIAALPACRSQISGSADGCGCHEVDLVIN